MIPLWTAILITFVIRVYGQTQMTTPNITLLTKVTQDNKMNFTCVAGPDVRGSAVTFITPLRQEYFKYKRVSTYKSAQGFTYAPDAYDCNFVSNPACTESWHQHGSVASAVSGRHWLAPVTDERWEKFLIFFSEFGNVEQYPFRQDIRNIAISVRTSGEATILLCQDGTSICYWITLNYEGNQDQITLWNCGNTNKTNPTRENNNCIALANGKGIPCSESGWSHFKLLIFPDSSQGKTFVAIQGKENNNYLLEDTIPIILNTKQILLHIGNNKKGFWKIHDYNYWSLKANFASNNWQQIGPDLHVDQAGTVCVELYVAVCPTCMLTLRLSQTNIKEIVNGQNDMQRWRLVRLEARNLSKGNSYSLNFIANGDYQNGFWLIDDVRRCHEDETRIISINAPKNENDTVTCQTLQQPKWSSSIKGGKIEQTSLTVCNNQTYTGSRCSVSCLAALGSDCSRLLVCEASVSRSAPACTCAAGYHGRQCQDLCPQGYYGSGCTNKCESCAKGCLPASGVCSRCSPGDTAPGCAIGMEDQQTTQSDFNPALYGLLLLLLIIPAVAWVVYRKYTKSANTTPDVVVSYSAVPTEQKITITNISPQSNLKPNNNNLLPNKLSKEESNIAASNATPSFISTNEMKDKKPIYSKIIKINNFSNYVKESLENGELEKEFKLLPEGATKPWIIGTSEENNQKNRYKNLTAYDHSRVILDKIPGDPSSDFINASYIDGYKQNKAYIATQGPRKNTVDDFWRMIWQENVSCIVMITNLIEEGKIKCEKYWQDDDKPVTYGLIHVTLLDTDTYADFIYRTFKIQKDKTIRQVEQYHFTSWPDHGVPLYPQSLVPFLNRLLTVSTAKAPIVVHCSAGIGRTGTIILSDICLRMAAKENQIDILKYFHSMREQRVNMIAKYDQYILVYMVLLESLLTPETSYPCVGLNETVDEIIKNGEIKKLMQYLKDTAWHNQVMAVIDKDITTKYASKNRFPDIVPNGRRMYLSKYTYDDDSSDYINAVPVDGFRIKNQFIVTQNPLPNTIKDFWRMILEFNIKVVVSLNEITNDKSSCKFWPLEKEELSPLPNVTLKCKSVINENGFKIYKIKLEDKRDRGDNAIKSVNIIHLQNWKYEQFTPSSEEQLVTVLDAAQKLPREDEPIVVTCYDGARACGLYVALSFIIEKIKLEHICDVCLAVRTVRNNREQFVNDCSQFEFLYKAAVRYISAFELYSNFNIPAKK